MFYMPRLHDIGETGVDVGSRYVCPELPFNMHDCSVMCIRVDTLFITPAIASEYIIFTSHSADTQSADYNSVPPRKSVFQIAAGKGGIAFHGRSVTCNRYICRGGQWY